MLENLYKKHGRDAQFFMIYIREAHPSDTRRARQNELDGISVSDPKTYNERTTVAQTCCTNLKLSMPCLVDSMSDSVNQAYGAWPDRLFVIDVSGKIAVKGDRGPRGFAPSIYAVGDWLNGINRNSVNERI